MSDIDKPVTASSNTPAGSNLPNFRAVQLEFAAHLRNPELHPKPGDVEERRMRVYRELVYNNIEGFIAGAFPIAKKLLSQNGSTQWHELVRAFVHQHASTSPYFLEVSQEFLEFLGHQNGAGLPPFFLELCHYEWVELALRVEEQDIPSTALRAGLAVPIDAKADLLDNVPVVSPLAKSLAYQFAVHRVRGDVQASTVVPAPTFLVVYRDPQDQVRFLEVNAMTTLLLELLDGVRTGNEALAELANRMSPAAGQPEVEPSELEAQGQQRLAKVVEQGALTLRRLRERSIILGAVLSKGEERQPTAG